MDHITPQKILINGGISRVGQFAQLRRRRKLLFRKEILMVCGQNSLDLKRV
jgi:hypothetical protein